MKKIVQNILLFFLFVLPLTKANAQIFNIEDRRGTFSDSTGMYENLNLGFGLIKNTKSVVDIRGTFQIEVLHKNRIFLSISKFHFVKAGGDEFVNEGFQHLRYNRMLDKTFDFETFGQVQYNTLVFINLRALAGSGFKIRLVNNEKQKFNVGVSVMYEYNEEAENNVTRSDVRISNYMSMAFEISSYATFSSTTYFQPLHNKIQDYRLSTNSTLRLKFLGSVDFITTFSLNYDRRVPDNYPHTIYSLSNGISYSF